MTIIFKRLALIGSGSRARWILSPMLVALLAMAVTPRGAQAQLTRVPQVAVLDFDNSGDPTGDVLARQATDAVAVEMTRTGRFDVIPRSQLTQQIQEMGLYLPLDDIAMRKLGQALGVDYVATGTIVDLSFEQNPRRARATLAVLLTDVASGELANGAVAVGAAAPPPAENTSDAVQSMITHALQNAAFTAVQTMNNYQLPEATVLTTRDGTVQLNQGSRSGIRVGQEFVIFRGGERVGRVRITDVSTHDATAVVTDPGRGIRPEDRARAIFALPGFRLGRR